MSTFQEIVWNSQDTVDYTKLQKMSQNDEVAYQTALSSPRGILSYTEVTEDLFFANQSGYVKFIEPESSFFVEKMRTISLNLYIPKITLDGGSPNPRFRFVLDNIGINTHIRAQNIKNISTNVDGASVSFKKIVTDLTAGEHTAYATVTDYVSTAGNRFYLAGEVSPIVFYIVDEGAQRAYV
jgi:hypothetical protein